MKEKVIWRLCLLAVLAMTVGCQSDDEEEFVPGREQPFSAMIPENVVTGFERMGLQGEWTLQKSRFENAPQFTEPVKVFFYPDGTAFVYVPDDFDYFMESGKYTYNTYSRKNCIYDGVAFKLRKGDKVYTGGMAFNSLHIYKPDDADWKMGMVCDYHRERTTENEIPFFFNDLAHNYGWGLEQSEMAIHSINSMDEFRSLVNIESELPQIDFNRYTLVLGWYFNRDRKFTFDKLDIIKSDSEYLFKVHLNYVDVSYGITGSMGCVIDYTDSFVLIWRLMPKFEKESVRLEVEETPEEENTYE